MKSKQEVIQEAWEQWGIPYSEKYVDANGFIAMKQDLPEIVYGALLDIRYSAEGHKDFDYKGGLYRPKSLRGIENNRGWTRIDNEEDLPKESDKYWVIYKDVRYNKDQEVFYVGKGWDCFLEITHYQPIMKPEAPIY